MSGCNGEGEGINSFALVSYLPSPLGEFLDRLRMDLVCDCRAKAHVTILPPRPLLCPPPEAWRELAERLQDVPPFHVELGDVEVFPVTQVVYLSVIAGGAELKRLHETLNAGRLAFEEPFEYHPHVTLAQDLEVSGEPSSGVAEVTELARARWHEFQHRRGFVVDKLTFVQNTLGNLWTDLNGFPLVSSVRI
jgi:2'-5' RNA ligase